MSSTNDVTEILKQLSENLNKSPANKEEDELLAKLKIYSRNPSIVQQFFSADVITLLAKYGLEEKQSDEALRCIANALLMVETNRQVFVDGGFALPACKSIQHCSPEREFLICRILFLLTYKTNLDFVKLDDEGNLCASITRVCQDHADGSSSTDIQRQALDETLKLLFNITHFFPALIKRLTPAIPPITVLLESSTLPSMPLQPPVGSLINALLNLDLVAAAHSTTNGAGLSQLQIKAVVDRLVEIFDRAIQKYSSHELDSAANPLCTLLRKIYGIGEEQVQKQMRELLLPQEQARSRPLGEGDTLAARLLRLSISTELPNLGSNISNLLFELSDKDPDKFVHNVGYGFASGFLLNHGMPAPMPSGTADSLGADRAYNPVTGQRLADEDEGDQASSEMTEEEKEREAERLFVLFERLKATGVVDVKNPVERLYKEGE